MLNTEVNMEGFNEEEFLTLLHKTPVVGAEYSVRPKAYSILIDGKTFVTSKGKTVWKQKNHAAAAFNNEMVTKVKHVVQLRLQDRGITRYEMYKCPEYRNAFENFKKALIERGLYQIIELQ